MGIDSLEYFGVMPIMYGRIFQKYKQEAMSWEPPTIDPQAVKFYTFAGSRQIDAQYIYIYTLKKPSSRV